MPREELCDKPNAALVGRGLSLPALSIVGLKHPERFLKEITLCKRVACIFPGESL